MKFKSYEGKRVLVPGGKEIVFGAEPYETDDKDQIEALKKAVEVVQVGGDGTDGSGHKVEIPESQTLEPKTSPEGDSMVTSYQTSDAELLQNAMHERGKHPDDLHLSKSEEKVVKASLDESRKSGVSLESTEAINDAKDAVKEANDGKLNTAKSNAVEQEARKAPKK